VVQVHLGPRTVFKSRKIGSVMKKLLSLALLAVAGYVIYQQAENSKAEQELWTQATSE
jgi:hypothetical protein